VGNVRTAIRLSLRAHRSRTQRVLEYVRPLA